MEDIIIYVIIGYCIYLSLVRFFTRDKSIKNNTSEEIESFDTKYPGHSLTDNLENIQLCLPGPYTKTHLRPWTLDKISRNMMDNLLVPILQQINKSENIELQLQNYNNVICKQYEGGIVSNLQFFVQDLNNCTTLLMGSEFVNTKSGILHCNYLRHRSHTNILDSVGPDLNRSLVNNQAKVEHSPLDNNFQRHSHNKISSLIDTILPLDRLDKRG